MMAEKPRNALTDFLVSEKDQRPYWETQHRGMVLPLVQSGYNNAVSYGIPGVLGGQGWQTMNDIVSGRSVTPDEIGHAAGDVAGAAMTGSFAGVRPSGSFGSGGMKMASDRSLTPVPQGRSDRVSQVLAIYSNPKQSSAAASIDHLGKTATRSLDSLGYYSQALEVAKGLQGKGSPDQYLSAMRNAGVKQAEIEATGLGNAFDGRPSITRDDLVKHITDNRVVLSEPMYGAEAIPGLRDALAAARQPRDDAVAWLRQVYPESAEADPAATLRRMAEGGNIGRFPNMRPTPPDMQAEAATRLRSLDDYHAAGLNLGLALSGGGKFQKYSLDPSNPSYREIVLHLPRNGEKLDIRRREIEALGRDATPAQKQEWADIMNRIRPDNRDVDGVQPFSGMPDFQSGHFSEPNIVGHMMTSLNKHEGKPVYTLDQIQSDWGQKLRDGGVRDEAKIAELKARADEAQQLRNEKEELSKTAIADRREGRLTDDQLFDVFKERDRSRSEHARITAEWKTAEGAATGHPLVNTTDQWTNTTLRRALQQAVDANADHIAVPSGKTVLGYNPGDTHGMTEFYDKIVPKNLMNIMAKLDKAGGGRQFVNQLETPGRGMAGDGFTLFPITPKMREEARKGLPLFQLGVPMQGGGLSSPEEERQAMANYLMSGM